MATSAPYKPQFYVDSLGIAEADAAYPLIRAIAPEVSSSDWRRYVRRRCREGGFKGLFDDKGMLTGLFSYRFGERLRQGRILALDDFVTFELSQAAPGRAMLFATAAELARSFGCAGIEVRSGARGIADAAAPKAQGWARLGISLDSVIFTKTFRDLPSN